MFDWFRRSRESDLDEEIQFHLDRELEEGVREGLSREDAEAAARRLFGNVGQVREATRSTWGWTALERVAQDTRHGMRTILRTPIFTLTAVLALAIGIGANVAAFSLADLLLLRPLPVAEPDGVVAITSQSPENPYGNVSHPVYRDIRDRTSSIAGVVGYELARFAFSPEPDTAPQMRFGLKVTENFFSVLGVDPAEGRAFAAGETRGAPQLVVLSHDLWKQQFAGDRRVLGALVRINGVPFTVIGVAPERFTGMDPLIRPAFFLPIDAAARLTSGGERTLEDRREQTLAIRARLAPGVSVQQAAEEVAALASALAQEYPEVERDRQLRVRTERDLRLSSSTATTVMIAMLMALSAAVLLMACANVAGLLLARSRARTREMAVRLALGAGRGRLVQQLLTEALLLATIAGSAGVALGAAAIQYLSSIRVPTDTPMMLAPELDARVLLFALLISAGSTLFFGLAPAIQAVSPNLLPALKGAANQEHGRRPLGRSLLVSGQVALSVVLLVVAVGLLDGFRKMVVLDPGIRVHGLLMMEFEPSMIGYSSEQTELFSRQMIERVRGVTGVRSATLTRCIPFRPNFTERPVIPEGYDLPKGESRVIVSTNPVDEAYFETIGLPVLYGRAFTVSDSSSSRRVAVVNEEFARRFWASDNAVGRRMRFDDEGETVEVVGVAKNAKYLSPTESPAPYIYLPLTQHPQNRFVMLVRTHGTPAEFTQPVLNVVRELDANQPVFNVRVFSDYYEQGVLGIALVALQMVGAIGISGLALALVGLYGLMAYLVARRTREIGVRMAVGASRMRVLRMILTHGLRFSSWGVGIGLALSIPVYRMLSAGLAGVGGASASTMVYVPLLLVLVTLAACAVPAWRATRIDPVSALREDG